MSDEGERVDECCVVLVVNDGNNLDDNNDNDNENDDVSFSVHIVACGYREVWIAKSARRFPAWKVFRSVNNDVDSDSTTLDHAKD